MSKFEKKLYRFCIVFFVMLNLSSMENPEEVLLEKNPEEVLLDQNTSARESFENASKNQSYIKYFYEWFKQQDARIKDFKYFNVLKTDKTYQYNNDLEKESSKTLDNNIINKNSCSGTLDNDGSNKDTCPMKLGNNIINKDICSGILDNDSSNKDTCPMKLGNNIINKDSYMSLAKKFLTENSKNIIIGGGAIAGVIILYKTVKYIIKNKKNSAVENDNSDSNIHNGK